MKALVQRVTEASVTIEGETVARIGKGYLVLFGVAVGDTPEMADKLAERLIKLRIFEDENGKTNRSIVDVGGDIIVVYFVCRYRARQPPGVFGGSASGDGGSGIRAVCSGLARVFG